MRKQEFLDELNKKLSDLSRSEAEERISFYSEMIDDRIEEGLSEEDAVSAIGTIDNVAMQITAEIPLTKIAKVNFKSKRKMKTLYLLKKQELPLVMNIFLEITLLST